MSSINTTGQPLAPVSPRIVSIELPLVHAQANPLALQQTSKAAIAVAAGLVPPPALEAPHIQYTIAELPPHSVFAGAAAAALATEDSDPRVSAANPAAAAVATAATETVTPRTWGAFLSEKITTPLSLFFNRARAQVAPSPQAPAQEAQPSIEQLLNGQHATGLKTKGFMLGSVGYGFFKTFSFLANTETKTLIGRISALETGAAEVQKAANKVAKALSNGDVSVTGIRAKQEKLIKGSPTIKTEAVNKALTESIHNLMLTAKSFIETRNDKDLPQEGPFLGNHTAYTQILGTLIQNNTVGVKLPEEAIKTISDLNFMAGSTLRNEVNSFAQNVDKALADALKETGAALPSLDDLISELQGSLGATDDQKAFIEARVLKKLGCDSLGLLDRTDKKGVIIPGKLQKIAETDPATMEIPELKAEAEGIHSTIDGFAVEIARLHDVQQSEKTVKAEKHMAFVDAMLAHITRAREERFSKKLPDSDEATYKEFLGYKTTGNLEKLEALLRLEDLAESVNSQPRNVLKDAKADKLAQQSWTLCETTKAAYEAATTALTKAQDAYTGQLIAVFGEVEVPEAAEIFEKDPINSKVIGFKKDVTDALENRGIAGNVRALAQPGSQLAAEFDKLDNIATVRDPAIRASFRQKQVAARDLFIRIREFKTAIAHHNAGAFKVADLLSRTEVLGRVPHSSRRSFSRRSSAAGSFTTPSHRTTTPLLGDVGTMHIRDSDRAPGVVRLSAGYARLLAAHQSQIAGAALGPVTPPR
ncbi:MAG: hypothetical protein NTX49_07755 [Chlamydiae bacterium]|nr:hypothetical protein [Chlamydiota bacterium]